MNIKDVGIELDEKQRIKTDETFKTNQSNIYAIGDVITGPMLAHKAEDEGIAVAENIVGQSGHVNYDTIPGVIYTTPEVASIGKTEEQLKEKNIDYKTRDLMKISDIFGTEATIRHPSRPIKNQQYDPINYRDVTHAEFKS